ncbi:P-type ATPase [Fusarium solani]|nr:P-type ATPase [Fusarium solani]
MAVDMKRMAPRNVIVRNLKSLEALGGVTSTLTQGTTIVKKVGVPGRGTYSVGATSEPFNLTQGNSASRMFSPRTSTSSIVAPKATPMNSEEVVARDSTLQEYLNVASLANLATIYQVEGEWHGRGNPTGIAI